MAQFEVSEFYPVTMEISKSGRRTIDGGFIKNSLKSNESEFEKLLNSNGVYVFSTKAGRGRKPWYVGKAIKMNFGKEAFNSRNCLALNKVIDNRKGTLEVSFITQSRARGKPNLSQISEIEYLLIGHAAERNSELLNIQNKNQTDKFSIKNIYNSGRGRSNSHETDFKKLMGL